MLRKAAPYALPSVRQAIALSLAGSVEVIAMANVAAAIGTGKVKAGYVQA